MMRLRWQQLMSALHWAVAARRLRCVTSFAYCTCRCTADFVVTCVHDAAKPTCLAVPCSSVTFPLQGRQLASLPPMNIYCVNCVEFMPCTPALHLLCETISIAACKSARSVGCICIPCRWKLLTSPCLVVICGHLPLHVTWDHTCHGSSPSTLCLPLQVCMMSAFHVIMSDV